jgi:hypothetical protein
MIFTKRDFLPALLAVEVRHHSLRVSPEAPRGICGLGTMECSTSADSAYRVKYRLTGVAGAARGNGKTWKKK